MAIATDTDRNHRADQCRRCMATCYEKTTACHVCHCPSLAVNPITRFVYGDSVRGNSWILVNPLSSNVGFVYWIIKLVKLLFNPY